MPHLPIPLSIIAIAFVLVLVALAAALVAIKRKGASQQHTGTPDVYDLRKSLFSPAERSFFGVLESLNYEGVTITAKVRLADLFTTKKGLERGDRQRAFNRISAKHVDFLLIQKTDGAPLLGIELDDSSHDEDERVARGAFVDAVFNSAGLPILHVAAKSAYDPKEIHRQIDQALAEK